MKKLLLISLLGLSIIANSCLTEDTVLEFDVYKEKITVLTPYSLDRIGF